MLFTIFINSMTEESKHYNDVMKKHFNKKLATTKKDDEDFKNSTDCCLCDKAYFNGDVKVRGHFYTLRPKNIDTLHIKIVISWLN